MFSDVRIGILCQPHAWFAHIVLKFPPPPFNCSMFCRMMSTIILQVIIGLDVFGLHPSGRCLLAMRSKTEVLKRVFYMRYKCCTA
jgi:hypothetical protein